MTLYFDETTDGDQAGEYYSVVPLIDQGEPTVGTPEVNEIREDGQTLMHDLQSQAHSWRSFAEQQYALITNLVEGWENPSDIDSDLDLVEFGSVQGSPLIWSGFSAGSITAPAATAPSDITLQDDDEVTLGEMPVKEYSLPDLDFTGVPEELDVTDPGDVPVLTQPTVPDNPSIVLPDAPTLEEIDLPADYTLTMPDFLAEAPSTEIDLPDGFQYTEGSYSSDLYDTVLAKLIADIEASSSGIDEDAEQAIYDRATSRMELEMDSAQQQAENYFAAKGFELPPGALSGRLVELQTADLRAKEDLNNDIIIQRSNLVQQNIQALMTAGLQLEDLLRNFHNQVWSREFAKQQEIAQNAVAIYNAKIEKLKALISVYNTEAEVYKSKIQGELAKVEAFKALVEKAKVSAEVQQQLVRIYLAKLDGVKTLSDIYKTQMESAKVYSDIEISKITAYRAGIDAYVARIQANTAKWQGYQSKVQAQGIKASVFGTQVDAYRSEVQAYSTKVGTEIEVAKLKLDQNQNKISHYLANIQKYQQEINFESQKIQAAMNNEDLQVRGKQLNLSGQQAASQSEIAREEIRQRAQATRANQEIEQLQANISSKVEEYRLHLEKMKSQANVLTQIAASALSAINSNLSYGFSAGISGNLSVSSGYSRTDSTSRSASAGKSKSNAFNVSHIYDHSE